MPRGSAPVPEPEPGHSHEAVPTQPAAHPRDDHALPGPICVLQAKTWRNRDRQRSISGYRSLVDGQIDCVAAAGTGGGKVSCNLSLAHGFVETDRLARLAKGWERGKSN